MSNSEREADIGLCHYRAMRRAALRVHRLYEARLRPVALGQVEFSMLAELGERGPIGLGVMARDFLMDRSALRYQLAPLVRRGLVELSPDPLDNRSRRAGITDAGRATLKAGKRLWVEAQADFESAIGREEAQALRTTLRVIASSGFDDMFAAASGARA